jgi:hypothetical protein
VQTGAAAHNAAHQQLWVFLPRSGSETPTYPTHNSQLEKYRPTNIKDVVGNVEAIARLQVIAEEGNMPNLILAVSASALQTSSVADRLTTRRVVLKMHTGASRHREDNLNPMYCKPIVRTELQRSSARVECVG